MTQAWQIWLNRFILRRWPGAWDSGLEEVGQAKSIKTEPSSHKDICLLGCEQKGLCSHIIKSSLGEKKWSATPKETEQQKTSPLSRKTKHQHRCLFLSNMVKQTEWQVEMRTTFTQVSLATYRQRSGTYTHGTTVFICEIKQNFRLQGRRLHCYGLTGVSSPNSNPQCHSTRRGAFRGRSRRR